MSRDVPSAFAGNAGEFEEGQRRHIDTYENELIDRQRELCVIRNLHNRLPDRDRGTYLWYEPDACPKILDCGGLDRVGWTSATDPACRHSKRTFR